MADQPKLTCLCGSISLAFPISLPASTELCHCNPCRQISGGLMAGFVELPHSPDTATLDKCTTYHSSATHDRLFCSTCGSKIVVHVHHHADGRERNYWFAYSGAVERAEGEQQSNIVRPETNEWVDDTRDGGLTPYMTQLGGRNVPAYCVTQSDPPLSQVDLEKLAKATSPGKAPGPDERLKAECRCGAIKLLIAPADHTDKATSKLERFVPFHPSSTSNEPITDKYQARTCVCRSCRLAMGVSLTPYAYIPPSKVLNAHTGEPLAYAHAAETPEGRAANLGLEALKHYWSSEDGCRSFCGTCGSTVFYWNENRQDIINIAAGILRAEEGALARRWLHWQPGAVSWKNEADQVVDRDILEAYVKADVN